MTGVGHIWEGAGKFGSAPNVSKAYNSHQRLRALGDGRLSRGRALHGRGVANLPAPRELRQAHHGVTRALAYGVLDPPPLFFDELLTESPLRPGYHR
jgi:hypothetical protein